MAVELGPLVSEVKEPISLDDISNKIIAVDAYNTIYQFLSIIRGPDGTPLKDSHGMVTSHLSGLFYRTINLLEHKITPVFVFDGIPPALKRRTIEARMSRRKEAQEQWEKALKEGMVEEARAHAMASTRITKEIVQSGKELLEYMGIAYIQAPSEGEAQAARLTREGLVYASATQDYDIFLFGADVAVRNLTISGRRKLPRKNVFVDITPERVELKRLLANLELNQKQLIWLGILMGTDFNEGIDGVGPKTALKIVKERKSLKEVVSYVNEKYKNGFEVDPEEVEGIFLKPETSEISRSEFSSTLNSAKANKEKIIKFMCDTHDFSQERIDKFADMLVGYKSAAGQKGISSWV
ncbi:MAG: flap endonuclease-1 [Candidatus Micrarchaeota archaeon]|nr:flap endonuclease-1 [Candidatus Micrarchaeota archaeon]